MDFRNVEATLVLRDYVLAFEGQTLPDGACAIVARLRGKGLARDLAEAAWAEVSPERRQAMWRAYAMTHVGLPCHAWDGQVFPVFDWRVELNSDVRFQLVLDPQGKAEAIPDVPLPRSSFASRVDPTDLGGIEALWGPDGVSMSGFWLNGSSGRVALEPWMDPIYDTISDFMHAVRVEFDRVWGPRAGLVLRGLGLSADESDPDPFLLDLYRKSCDPPSNLQEHLQKTCQSSQDNIVRRIAQDIAEKGLPRKGQYRLITGWNATPRRPYNADDLIYGRGLALEVFDDSEGNQPSYRRVLSRLTRRYRRGWVRVLSEDDHEGWSWANIRIGF